MAAQEEEEAQKQYQAFFVASSFIIAIYQRNVQYI